ncbi:MAG TPA: branched-chain amino acid aminotransferase [Stellaceae bacterium]|jgi:branched-chain amino acid aminotransferase|nr:branched-chain amino acid aminotransferase [Stellaceae bacterium]
MAMKPWSKTWTFLDGDWHEGNVPIMGARSHAAWAGTSVFDGARAFEGVTPDLDLHCARVNRSAATMMLAPLVPVEQWVALAKDGIARFDQNAALYLRPFYWAEAAGFSSIVPGADSTRWCLTIYEAAMAKPNSGLAITLSPYRRPTQDSAPLEAKAGCLYPNNARAMAEAHARGFDNCLMLDQNGHVAELAIANIFMAKDGTLFTPAPNGTFLDGITRRRVIGLLGADGIDVVEESLRYADFAAADEIFATGNLHKVQAVTRIDDRALQPGPMFRRARELYWAFAHG